MRRMLFVAAATLAGPAAAQAPMPDTLSAWTQESYPPCSRTVTDHCVQVQELARAQRAALRRVQSAPVESGVGGPYEPVEYHANAVPSDEAAAAAEAAPGDSGPQD